MSHFNWKDYRAELEVSAIILFLFSSGLFPVFVPELFTPSGSPTEPWWLFGAVFIILWGIGLVRWALYRPSQRTTTNAEHGGPTTQRNNGQ